MEVIITFLVAVAAGVACHYIIKWLDGDHKDNKSHGGCFATVKRKEEALDCVTARSGASFFVRMDLSLPFAYWHYSIRNSEMQYS